MAINNKNKDKSPVLEEIENDDTSLDDKGKPIDAPVIPTLEELLSKDPLELTAIDMDILSENKDELTDEQKVAVGLAEGDILEDKEEEEDQADSVEQPIKKVAPVVQPEETQEDKDQRYKAQQTEAQIQAEKNRALIDNVEKADQIPEPTTDELKAYVRQDGVDWDELTAFEQSMAKKTYLSEKKFQFINDAVKGQKQVDVWAKTVDDFIDSTDSKPEYIELSSHESEFRKFAMIAAHRTTPVEILLAAFLRNMPVAEKKRGNIFQKGGGGEKPIRSDGSINDADQVQRLRVDNPREYARQVKAGKVRLDV